MSVLQNRENGNFIFLDSIYIYGGQSNIYAEQINNDIYPDLIGQYYDGNINNIACADLNDDGRDDIVIVGQKSACADLDGNGYNDIVTIRYLYAPIPNVNILFNHGNGVFGNDPVTKINQPETEKLTPVLKCFPNPFRDKTTIRYVVKSKMQIRVDIIDMNGNIINTLTNKMQQSGVYETKWNGKSLNGKEIKAGVSATIQRIYDH